MTPREPADPAAGPALLQDVLAHERAYHDTCRAALAAMVEGAGEQVVVGEDVSASGADAEVLGYRLRSRAKEMRELPEGPLFFGRLDFAAQADSDHAGQSYHLGRLRISEDPAAPPLVVDWRAPVSRAFYQASSRDPQGVAVRRRFGWAPGSRGDSTDLTGLEDEHLAGSIPGAGAGAGAGARVDTSTPGSLLAAEIERPRLGPMRDIAATIQPEQDDLVRADLATSVCVQGAPGTGKTAVGLHRAAYLLYTHPQRIRRGGLLILGPNRTFLSYIAEVLPALGETGVRQSTVTDEIARHEVRAEDDERAAVVKHDARMAEVLRRALYAGVASGERARAEAFGTLVLAEGSYRWRVAGDELRRIVAGVRAEELPYDVGRERVRARVVRLLQEQAERRAGPRPNAWLYRISRSRPVGAYVDAVWPKVRPEEVVARLLGDPDVLAGAAEGLLDADEQKAVAWAKPPRTWRSARWSAADLVLLDEVAGLLAHPDGYGHVVVDEAQDLSPMECRAIARRAAYGSVTVLGDLAQGTTPWAARDWPGLLAHLGKPDAHVVPLTTGFRVPRAVVGLANGLLDRLGVDVPAARSLRRDGELRIRRVEGAEVVAEAVAAVRDALACEGSVGVIAADGPDVVRLCQALDEAGIPVGGPDELRARVTVLGAGVAKGLEYDHVVVVEPVAIAAAEERGLHRLYVVLTRAVSRLDVVHARALPW
ncbi:HelD family protein [Streptomyces caniscabiei]|uniref:HelD family protein n=1 Tax=Streptomyces caniscabiei TaxID=2746961 RepID=UPI001872726E|nr:ATP-binding domain-containing protein [Streptomyces caniscabiei]MBE4738114.1 ATP-binding domain-containing protein [Streptomyces caniscabiei]MBE4756877.1 ATP-binding domain-containing protein [Streptomyces caniscabiei]MBE4773817.1 ATP-binding domain-containing protein [Streptomyces caniscabiei]MDX2950793.1 ATP-binding domain-containing protein [Streptomyces caniscabiei]